MQTFTSAPDLQMIPEISSLTSGVTTQDTQYSFRDLGTTKKVGSTLCAYDLFSLFTANIIRLDVAFTR